MPTYTFPVNVYKSPVITNPFKADEIDVSVTPPVYVPPPGVNTPGRARLLLTTNNQSGLSGGSVSITVPRSAVVAVVPPPSALTIPTYGLYGSTYIWTFNSAPKNTGPYEFHVDFMPAAAGKDYAAVFDVSAQELLSTVEQSVDFIS